MAIAATSLSVSAFFLRLVCTNGMVAKTEISASYRHVSTKILVELTRVFEKVSYELGNQRDRFQLSLESQVDDPLATLDRFNKQSAIRVQEPEREAVDWACDDRRWTTAKSQYGRNHAYEDCERIP